MGKATPQNWRPDLSDFDGSPRIMVLNYSGSMVQAFRFKERAELEEDLARYDIHLETLKKATVFRVTPPCLGQSCNSLVYEEVPHAERLLRRLQKPYIGARRAACLGKTTD